MKKFLQNIILCGIIGIGLACCSDPIASPTAVTRDASLPPGAIKMLPINDPHPPELLSPEFEAPIPLPGEVNTAGAEDSPFILPDGNTLFFWFTPDPGLPAEKQLFDGVTGIYVSRKISGRWNQPERIILQETGKLGLDGCAFILGDSMWFCSAREGYTGIHWFTARYRDGIWQDWQEAGFDPAHQVGELHFSQDGRELYFHSDRPGGKGNLDLWVSQKIDGKWQEPVNLSTINTADSEGWPALNPEGNELWFTRNYSIWRTKKRNDEWQAAEKIVSSLAGEPTIDANGNLIFVHHFLVNENIIEADIYIAYQK